MEKYMKIGRIVIAVIVVAAVAFTVYRFVGSKKVEVVTDTRPGVMTVEPERRNIVIYTEQIGTIAPTQSVSVFPKVGGEALSVNFNVGDNVNAGDVLATINSDALTALKIQMDAAKVTMNDTATALSRTQALADTGAVATQVLEQARSAATSAALNYEAAKSQYDLQSSYTSIKAPISGVVETKGVEVHDMIAQSTAIATISGNSGMEVKFGATVDVQNHLKAGDQIKVLHNGTEYNGNITEISNALSSSTGLYDVKASLEGEALQSGMKVKLTLLKNKADNVLTLPISAVMYSGNDAYIYLYREGKAVKKNVNVGIYDSDYIEIKDGINTSDKVISTWSNELYDGAEVLLSQNEGVESSADETVGNAETESAGNK
jgi:efflux transporter, RND family, MFP subunit